jgi:hypothetical protein
MSILVSENIVVVLGTRHTLRELDFYGPVVSFESQCLKVDTVLPILVKEG